MGHALPVRGGERVGHLRGDRQRLVERHAPLLETRGERLAFQVFHHQEIQRRARPLRAVFGPTV